MRVRFPDPSVFELMDALDAVESQVRLDEADSAVKYIFRYKFILWVYRREYDNWY